MNVLSSTGSRQLLVIDPENDAQVDALVSALREQIHMVGDCDSNTCAQDCTRAALRSLLPVPQVDTRVRCPECVQGKCTNCTGKTLDPTTDEMVWCECGCHK